METLNTFTNSIATLKLLLQEETYYIYNSNSPTRMCVGNNAARAIRLFAFAADALHNAEIAAGEESTERAIFYWNA